LASRAGTRDWYPFQIGINIIVSMPKRIPLRRTGEHTPAKWFEVKRERASVALNRW